ncbi:MAG: ATP-binding protein [Pseudomonas profundi]|nr:MULTISPECIES: ATP-binding protein [Pseudomonas]QIB49734.1 HAMP domain-containing histidine kinase [Pseudomonas sp. OIL-1]
MQRFFISPNTLALSPTRQNLWRLILIRLLVWVAQSLSVAGAYLSGWFPLPWLPLLITLGISALVSVLTVLRLSRGWPVTEPEYGLQLLFDMLVHSVLLYYSGGPTNPFVSYYLVPLTIAAATLPWFYTLLLACVAISAYSLLLVWYKPLDAFELPVVSHMINLHVIGMWLNFAMSAALISFFVVRMAAALRQHADHLAERREQGLRDAQLLGIASVAAGAAHELSTPLSTMSVLLKDMRADYVADPQMQEDLTLLQQQVAQCKESLQHMVRTAEDDRLKPRRRERADAWLNTVLARWHLMRPEASWQWKPLPEGEVPWIQTGPELGQALLNLLNNAADACPNNIQIELVWDADWLRLRIRDYGPGVPLHIAEQLGTAFLTTKGKKGFGLGLFLSQAAVERLGGSVRLYNQDGGGTLTEVTLPTATEVDL